MKTDKSDLTRLEDKSFALTFNFSPTEIAKTKQQVLAEIQKTFTLKGFRPGKVSLDIVEQNTDESHLIEHILTDLLNEAYPKKVTEYNLRPIIDPKISVLNPPLDLNKEWQLKVESCELPEMKLDPKYQKEITTAKTEDINQILEIIVKNSTVAFSQILLDTELNRQISRIIDQTQQAGITFADYLKSKNLDNDKFKENALKDIKNEWIINLAISQISIDNKLIPSETEFNEYIEKQPQFKSNPSLVNYILTQQKVIEFLKKL